MTVKTLMSRFQWYVDNWGANPASGPGTVITPGAAPTEGNWTQVLSATSYAIWGFHLFISNAYTSGLQRCLVVDVGVDPAGGTSYTQVIANMVVGHADDANNGGRNFFFPLYIPAGATVAARGMRYDSTGDFRFAIRGFGQPVNPEQALAGCYSESFAVDAQCNGTFFTPGNAADGSWVSLGTTINELWWLQGMVQIGNATIAAQYTYVDFAYGDASNKHIFMRHYVDMRGTAESVSEHMGENMVPLSAYCPIPAGSTLYVRGRCNITPADFYSAQVVGIGGVAGGG